MTYIWRETSTNNKVTSLTVAPSLGWKIAYSKKVYDFARKQKLLEKDNDGNLRLTEIGLQKANYYDS